MNRLTSAQCLALLAAFACSPMARAHEGHGLDAFSHWHSTDAWGFVVIAVVGMAMWLGGRK